ncbi:MAG: aspartate aminotransferase family protein [Cyclobacteriaceae bacterium]
MLSQRQLFLNYVGQTSDFPLELEILSAKGIYMFGRKGEKYIDLISGIGVSNVGHRHQRVIGAIQRQLRKYLHLMVYGEFVQSPQARLAKAIVDTLPKSLDNVFFVNSGSEAIEGAMKLAKRFTGRTEIISCHRAYHGSTHGALSIGGGEEYKNNFRPLLPDVKQIHFGVEKELEKISIKTAAFVIETVQGEAGVRTATQPYFEAIRKRCDETGTLLIMDEIQCGVGRTGRLWAFEHYGIVPDIVTIAKGMGGGMPIGAFISSQEIMSVLKNNPILGHITTFGGHPVCCAASLATFQVIQKEKLLDEVERKAQLFKDLLVHSSILSIRNKGLMMAVEFESFNLLKKVIDQAIKNGVLTDWFLYCDNSMRIAPPLIITEKEIKKACKLILKSIDEVTG